MSENKTPEIEDMPMKMPTPVGALDLGQQEQQQEIENLINDEIVQTQSPVKETQELDKIPVTNNDNNIFPSTGMTSQPLIQPLSSMTEIPVQPLVPNLVGDFDYNVTSENTTSPLKSNSNPFINDINNENQESSNPFIASTTNPFILPSMPSMPQPTSDNNNNQTEQNVNEATSSLPHENLFSPTDNLIDTVINNSKPNDSIMDETPVTDHDLLETPLNMETNNSDSFGFVIPNNNINNFVSPPQFPPQQSFQTEINPFEDPLNIIHDSETEKTNKIQNPVNIMDSSIPPLQQPIEVNVETPLNNTVDVSVQQQEEIKMPVVAEVKPITTDEVNLEFSTSQTQNADNVVEEKNEINDFYPPQPEPLPEIPKPKDIVPEETNAEKLIITSDDIISPVNIMDAVIHNQTHTSDNPSNPLQNEIDYNLIPSIEDESPIVEKPTKHHHEHHEHHEGNEVVNQNENQKTSLSEQAVNLSDDISSHNNLTEEIIKMPQPVNHEDSTIPAEESKPAEPKPEEETKTESIHSNDEIKNTKNDSGKIKKVKSEDKELSPKTNVKNKLEKPKTTSSSTVKRQPSITSTKLRNVKTATTSSKSSISSLHPTKPSTTTNSSRLTHKPLTKSTTSSNTKLLSSAATKTKTLPRMTSTNSTTSSITSSRTSTLHKPSTISTSTSPHTTRHSVSTSPKSSTLKSATKTTKSTSPVSAATKSRVGVSSPASKSRIGASSSSSLTKPKVSTSSTTTPTSKTSRVGLTSRISTSKISSNSRTISKPTTTPTSSRTPVKSSISSSTTPTSRLASRVKPNTTTSSTMRKISTGITKTKSTEKTEKTPISSRSRTSISKSTSADKEIIEKQSKEIQSLEQKIKDLNDQIEEQLLVSSVTSKQDLNNAINGLKENIKQLCESNNENNNIDEITNSINESFGIIENFANLIEFQEQNYGKLKVETAKLNKNLANVTLLCDEEHNKKLMDDEAYKNEIQRLQQMTTTLNNSLSNVTLLCDEEHNKKLMNDKVYKNEIQRLQQMATTLNNSLSRVTLLCDEIKKEQNTSGIEQLDTQIRSIEQPVLQNDSDNVEVDQLRQSLANINSKLATVTLLCDKINKEKKNNINNLEQQIEHFKNLSIELNNRITNLTFYCDQLEYGKSINKDTTNNEELSQELDEYKMMLQQKDLVIQQLQNQIEQLEENSVKEENETMNQLIQENAALKLKVSELSDSKTDNLPLDLTANPEEELEEEIIQVNGKE